MAITIRQYNPDTGALLSNVNTISFGKIVGGTTSKTAVIDIAFSEVTEVSDISLGLINSGGLTVASNASDTSNNSDGSSTKGYFGIVSSAAFDSSIASNPLTSFFKGINATVTAGDVNNVEIPNRSATLSNYIYLNITPDAASTGSNSGSWKVFFNYS